MYICGTFFSFHIIALTRPSAKLFTPITLIIFLHQQMTTLGVGRTFSVLCVLRFFSHSIQAIGEMRVSETGLPRWNE